MPHIRVSFKLQKRNSTMNRTARGLTFVGLLLAATAPASADVLGQTLGTGSPPGILGGYSMTPFGPDPQPLFVNVNSVQTPVGGSIGFGIPLEHVQVGNGWATWSNGYTGDVYANNGAGDITITMPSGTGAFYLYAEPNAFAIETIIATGSDGTSSTLSQPTNGQGGATGYGFFAINGESIATITISDPESNNFAIGEFGISGSVPEPSSMVLAGIGTLGLVAYRLARKRLSRKNDM
jgi:hypothetical protein